MRIASLELRAFGPFRDVALDLSASPAVHVVYGPNEAGKSTALRAITGLLYGIPHVSPDAHSHRPEDLRIAGRLVNASGAALSVVRRKGRVRTLLDEDGLPLPEHALSPFLAGIGEDVFLAAFGLNHETLRLGAQALLEGRGHLGESLFGAGLGGTGIAEVLASLRREADELFSPLARTRKLNLALRSVIEAKKRVQDQAMPAAAWLAQEQAIREAHGERQRIDDEGALLRAEERRLRRARTLQGLLSQLRAARAAREALGEVPSLPDDAAGERALAEAEIADAAAQSRRAEEALARLLAQQAALSIPHALLAQGDAIEDVSTRLGSHRKAAIDLPRVRAELRAQEEEAVEILRTLGLGAGDRDLPALRAEVEPLRVDAAREERIRGLYRDASALVERVRQAEEELERCGREVEAAEERAAALPRPRDLGPLRRAEGRAKALGDVAAAIEKAARSAALLEARAVSAAAALGLGGAALGDVRAMAVPLAETVDLCAAEERALRSERAELDARAAESRGALARIAAQLSEVAGWDLPTEADLGAARTLRDMEARAAREALSRGDTAAAAEALSAMEWAALSADRLADRLRAEADRVAKRAGLLADQKVEEAALSTAEREIAEARLRAEGFESRWRALWAGCDVAPRSAEEMRGWLRRHEALVGLIDQLDAARADLAGLRARAREAAAELSAALPSPAGSAPREAEAETEAAALVRLLDAAEVELAALGEASRREAALSAARSSRADVERRLEAHRAALAEWRAAWDEAIARMPVRGGASPGEVLRVLETLSKLFSRLDESRRTARRVEGMERDAREFASRVEALAREHAPELRGRPPEVAAVEMARRFHQARSDLEKLAVLKQQVIAAGEALSEQRDRAERARARVEALMRAAGVQTPEEMARAEALSVEAKRLDRRVELLKEQVQRAGDSAPEEDLTREVEALGEGPEGLSARIEEIEQKLADNARDRSQIDRTIGARTEGLEKLREGGDAADAALDLAAAVAHARSLVLSYARSRAASLVLEREIETYKKRHQGPIVARAGELFRAMTLGSFTGLSAGYDEGDQATLRCVRDGGREVDVDGLSDGTRDQLYLSLRLASIERFAAHAEPLPLVLDDAFVHFDDARAQEALAALCELSPAVQVLFFTHHERLVSIAEASLPATRVRIHRLSARGPSLAAAREPAASLAVRHDVAPRSASETAEDEGRGA